MTTRNMINHYINKLPNMSRQYACTARFKIGGFLMTKYVKKKKNTRARNNFLGIDENPLVRVSSLILHLQRRRKKRHSVVVDWLPVSRAKNRRKTTKKAKNCLNTSRKIKQKDLSILQYDVIFLSPDFLRKLRGFSKSFAYVGSVAKGNIG